MATAMTYENWENELNSLGPFGPLHRLRALIDSAPSGLSGAEQDTVALAERVYIARAQGRDVLEALAA